MKQRQNAATTSLADILPEEMEEEVKQVRELESETDLTAHSSLDVRVIDRYVLRYATFPKGTMLARDQFMVFDVLSLLKMGFEATNCTENRPTVGGDA